jgi:hypothetical protein
MGRKLVGFAGNPDHRAETPWYKSTHSVVCLTTGSQQVLHRVRASVSSSSFQYPLTSLSSSSSCWLLLPRLQITSILPSIFPSILCYRRQFTRTMWPIQLPFLLCIRCGVFLTSLTLYSSSFLTRSVHYLFHPSPTPHVKTFQVFLIYFLKCPSFSPTQSYVPNVAYNSYFLKFKYNLLVKLSFSCWIFLLPWQSCI